MEFIGIQRSLDVSLPPEKQCALEGEAALVFPEGHRIPVMATLAAYRRLFRLSGSGCFHCSEGIGLEAFNCKDVPKLVFDGAAEVEIEVFKVRTEGSQAKCWFRVRSGRVVSTVHPIR
jgi:hypothetical protein